MKNPPCRLWIPAVAALGIGLGAPAPVRADVIGNLVNDLMESVLYGEPAAPELPAFEDRRPIPQRARLAVMSPPRGRLVTLDGRPARLAPGAQIRDLGNRIVLPARLRGPVRVRYVLNAHREIQSAWIMPPEPRPPRRIAAQAAER